MSVVVEVDLRPQFGPARDQGARPTCLAFCASDTHAALRSGWDPLSCEYAYFQAQRRAGRPPTSGALLSAMLEAFRKDGQPEEAGWPYLESTPIDAAFWVPPPKVGPLFGRAGETAPVTLDQIIQELNQSRPMMLLLKLSGAFYLPTADGVVHPAIGEIPDPGLRHAVVAVGHGTVNGHRSILVRNSWGRKWGRDGHGWLTEPFLGPRIFAAAKLTEDVDVPAGSAPA